MQDPSIPSLINRIKTDCNVSLTDSFINDVPDSLLILRKMAMTAMNWHSPNINLWEIGKSLQAEDGFKKYDIPFAAELECAAGLWLLIYTHKI